MAAAPAAQEPNRELTELEGLQLKCNQVTDDSLESTRRMMDLCAEAKDAGKVFFYELKSKYISYPCKFMKA